MKKILLLIILLSVSFLGFSQDVKYGVRGGLNISNLNFETDAPVVNKHRNSMYVGFFVHIGLSKVIALTPEIQFSAEGAREETIHLDYIQAPIGPQVGLKVHKVDDGIKNIAYSGLAGVEYKITHTIFADARYTYGFSNVFDEDLSYSANNTNIQIGIGYKF